MSGINKHCMLHLNFEFNFMQTALNVLSNVLRIGRSILNSTR
jgi:hypothetical protein